MDTSERPVQPRQRTVSFYLVLVCLVLPFWSTIPVSWFFVIYHSIFGAIWLQSWPSQILFGIALSEMLFSIYYLRLSYIISRPPPHGGRDLREVQAAFKRLLQTGLADLPENGSDEEELQRPGSPEEKITLLERDDRRAIDFRNALRPWFGNAPWSAIKLHQLRQWLYWAIYNADLPPYQSLPESQKAVMSSALELLQKRCGCSLEEGSNPAAQPMRLSLDRLSVLWRPFIFYVLIYLINFFLGAWYRIRWGVRFEQYDGLEYFIRIPKHWNPANGPRPMIFIHGLGLGLLQYNTVLRHLLQHLPDRPVLVLLQPHISQNIFHCRFLKPMDRHQTVHRLSNLIKHFGWGNHDLENEKILHQDNEEKSDTESLRPGERRQGVSMMSHSNGSYVHAWMLKSRPDLIHRSCFIDPVTFCSWEGDVCFNFLYRKPMAAMELLMYYFVATEAGVSNLLRKHFDWTSNTLWFEEIPNAQDPSKAFFLIGGKDSILNPERVKRYLTSHGVKQGIWYDPDGKHGQALLPGTSGSLEILRWARVED